MDVQLYVYDLSKGLARQLSAQFLGTQIDAVYHTSLVFGGIEYFFGQGVHMCYPGTTHHGAPMEIIPMGKTDLPMEVILEYLDALKQIYTAESYDLFLHNCNNFSNDFAMFLVGRGIPGHITSLPQTVLNTPFGQMLRPQIDSAMRSITQAPIPPQQVPPASATSPSRSTRNGMFHKPSVAAEGKVHNVSSLREVESLLDSALKSCAIIFFTSSTCAPCKLVYPAYDDLAAKAGMKAVFIKVDINNAYEVSAKYSVRATPTFMTFLKGQKQEEWSGADENRLRSNAQLLLNAAFPPHPHLSRSVPTLLRTSLRPVTYAKVPPLDKLIAKMGETGRDPAVASMVTFIRTLSNSGAIEAPLPNLPAFAQFLQSATNKLPPDLLFTVFDLLRTALADSRVAGFFAEEHTNTSNLSTTTIIHLLTHVDSFGDTAPYNLRLTTLHLACNLFSSPLFIPHLLAPPFSTLLVSLLTTALLDGKHTALRASATTLALNLAASNHQIRMRAYSNNTPSSSLDASELPEGDQVEMLASLLETLGTETESQEVLKMCVICIGWLAYCAPVNGEVKDLCAVMDAAGTVLKVKFVGEGKEGEGLAREVGREVLGRGW
ncbi:DUF862-domain-containing protein [Lepidopterella palustris CBS 459.81]|uniref:DUF862-domain-containing protein n=1 Tax=Lepidopterella palustris CBS 459.81 TaxID=1314670 RepID=A0A8E2JFV7_9PEZI|nr:DUF862-domain-containing protein [Lepidopterella palustris CBS 459.81]